MRPAAFPESHVDQVCSPSRVFPFPAGHDRSRNDADDAGPSSALAPASQAVDHRS
jgi:hypothetical protein